MTQLSLFDPPAIRTSPTSIAAAESIQPGRGETLTLDWLRKRGSEGATDLEIAEHFGWDGSYQRPRRINLVRVGLVRDSGLTRLTRSGRRAVVWVAERGVRA